MFGGFADDHEDRNHIAVAALARGRRVLDPHLQPQEVVVIGDTPFDVRCGKFIGAKTLAVATGGSNFEELFPAQGGLDGARFIANPRGRNLPAPISQNWCVCSKTSPSQVGANR